MGQRRVRLPTWDLSSARSPLLNVASWFRCRSSPQQFRRLAFQHSGELGERTPLAGASRFIADVLLRPINEMLSKTINHEAGTRQVRIEAVKRLLIVSAFLVVLSGCGLGEGRDVRAYNTCLARHPQDVVVCEGPRQAYEVDSTIIQARSATAVRGYGEGSPLSDRVLKPAPLHSGPIPLTPDPNG